MAQRIEIKNRIISLFIIILIFSSTFFVLMKIERMQPLVHDEAVYLSKARSWIEDTPANEFRIYRPIGMAWLGWIFLQFSDSEKFLRIFGVLFSSITLVFVYLLFEKIANRLVGFFVSVTVFSSTLFLQNAPQFLNDIPSTGFLIGSMWVILDWYKTDGKSNLIYLFAPFSAFAFYLRYGVATSLIIIIAMSILIFGLKFIKNENASYERIFDTVLLTLLLFLPHFIESFFVTNNFLGILMRAGNAAGREYLGEGLVDYIRWMPNEIGGWLFGYVSIIGIIITIIFIFSKKIREKNIELFWIGFIALSNFIFTGLLVHAEPRYIFFPLVLFVGVSIVSIFSVIKINIFLKYIFVIVYLVVNVFFWI